MKHHEALAVAKDLKERIKTHLDKGEALLKLQPGLEQYREVLQFNAIADDILHTYSSQKVTVSNEDYSTHSVQERVVSLESLLSKVTQFLRLTKKKAEDPTSYVADTDVKRAYGREKFVHWLMAEYPKLVEGYQNKDGSITLSKTSSLIFKDIDGDVFKTLKSEVDFLYRVGEQIKNGLKPITTYHRSLLNSIDSFVGKDDEVDKLIKHLTQMLSKQPKPFNQTFKSPTYTFLGAGKVEWFGEESYKRFQSYPNNELREVKQLEVKYPDKDILEDLGGLMFRIVILAMGYEELIMAIPTPVDMTEQPFRAYRDNAEVRELVSKSIFLDPSLDFYIYNPLEVIAALLSGLELALGEYLMKVVK